MCVIYNVICSHDAGPADQVGNAIIEIVRSDSRPVCRNVRHHPADGVVLPGQHRTPRRCRLSRPDPATGYFSTALWSRRQPQNTSSGADKDSALGSIIERTLEPDKTVRLRVGSAD